MIIKPDMLKKTCKEMIQTIFLCLDNAYRGTIYMVGLMPELQTMKIATGFRGDKGEDIEWGLLEHSDYDYPGKSWEQYRDRPGGVLEAMAWCVEEQKSWTAEDPLKDTRSVRKQLEGELEDFHHMEPVLIQKKYLFGEQSNDLEYPVDWKGDSIWKDSEYVVVAVIKMHFLPYSIKRGDPSTKVIKKLSHILGTELLSLHVRETSLQCQQEFARQRLQTCNILAHELRNTVMKLGFVFSAINAEISFFREQWETHLEQALPDQKRKSTIIPRLNDLVLVGLSQLNGAKELIRIGKALYVEQQQYAGPSLLPAMREKFLEDRIRPKWKRLTTESQVWKEQKNEIEKLLECLAEGVWAGQDDKLLTKVKNLPEDLKVKWHELAYLDFTTTEITKLEDLIQFLDHPSLMIPHKQQSKKILISLKVIAEVLPELEEKANNIIYSLKNGLPLGFI